MPKIFLVFFIFCIASCGGSSGSTTTNNNGSFVNPVINNFYSDKYNLVPNQSFNITWSANANSCSASGDWTGEKEISGNETLSFSSNGIYVLILNCSGGEGTITARSSISIYVSDDGGYSSFCKTPVQDSSEYWLEEFNNPRLDSDVFSYQIGSGFFDGNGTWIDGWGNNEPQYYTGPGSGEYGNYAKNYNSENNTTENLFIEDGYLKIQPIYNDQNPFLDPYNGTTPKAHTSAKIITSDKKIFELPAKITVCFKVPDGTGFWPAIWMLPQGFMNNSKVWPDDGEIDLMEARGRLSQVVGSAMHFRANWGTHHYLSSDAHVSMAENFQDTFHSITFEWTQNSIKMYLDNDEAPFFDENSDAGPLVNTYYPFNEPFYLILNVASGGDFDSSYETDTTSFCHNAECSNLSVPDRGRFLIDYIEYKSID